MNDGEKGEKILGQTREEGEASICLWVGGEDRGGKKGKRGELRLKGGGRENSYR